MHLPASVRNLVLIGFMGFELVQTQQGYKQGVVTKAIGGLIGQK